MDKNNEFQTIILLLKSTSGDLYYRDACTCVRKECASIEEYILFPVKYNPLVSRYCLLRVNRHLYHFCTNGTKGHLV